MARKPTKEELDKLAAAALKKLQDGDTAGAKNLGKVFDAAKRQYDKASEEADQ